jgi:hypothetical protein
MNQTQQPLPKPWVQVGAVCVRRCGAPRAPSGRAAPAAPPRRRGSACARRGRRRAAVPRQQERHASRPTEALRRPTRATGAAPGRGVSLTPPAPRPPARRCAAARRGARRAAAARREAGASAQREARAGGGVRYNAGGHSRCTRVCVYMWACGGTHQRLRRGAGAAQHGADALHLLGRLARRGGRGASGGGKRAAAPFPPKGAGGGSSHNALAPLASRCARAPRRACEAASSSGLFAGLASSPASSVTPCARNGERGKQGRQHFVRAARARAAPRPPTHRVRRADAALARGWRALRRAPRGPSARPTPAAAARGRATRAAWRYRSLPPPAAHAPLFAAACSRQRIVPSSAALHSTTPAAPSTPWRPSPGERSGGATCGGRPTEWHHPECTGKI